MSYSIKKEDFWDLFLVSLLFLQLVILDFCGFSGSMNKILSILMIARMIFVNRKNRKDINKILILTFCLVGINFLLGTSNLDIFKSNILLLVYPIIYIYYVSFLAVNKKDFVNKVTRWAFCPINIIMVLNLLIIYVQIKCPYLIVAKTTGTITTYYEDLISGLFGYQMTHALSLYTIFVVLYNISYSYFLKDKIKIIILFVYTLMIVGISLYYAMINDNKAFFLIFPFFIFIYFWGDLTKSTRGVGVFVVAIITAITGVGGSYLVDDKIRMFCDEHILSTIDMVVDSWTLGTEAYGSNERTAIIGYSVKKCGTWLWGQGLGSAFLFSEKYDGFRHFGISDMGSLLVLGGMWLFILLTIYYCRALYEIIDCGKKNIVLFFGVGMIVLLTTYYTQCFTRTSLMSCLILIALSFRLKYINKYLSEE